MKKVLSCLIILSMLFCQVGLVKAESQGIDNLTHTLTTIDGKEVSTKAEGKPKVLFFFKVGCGNCHAMAKMLPQREDIDIIAAEFTGATSEQAKNFYDAYCPNNVVCCYNSSSVGWAYVRSLMSTTSLVTPFVVYINTNNKIVHYSTGYDSDIKKTIETYFGKPLKEENVSINNESYVYDGTAKTPSVTVKDGSKTLVKDTDYTVSYKNNVNAGIATVTVIGKGNYAGNINKTFTINKASYNVTAKDYKGTYDSKSHTITLSGVKSGSTIKYRTSQNGEWTSKKPTRTSAGTTTVYYQITNANYETITGSKKITIAKRNVSTLKYSKLGNKTYTGKKISYAPTVKYGSKTLKNGTDYNLSYKNNVSTGKATVTVTVTGKGNYEGSKTFTFYIVPKKVTLSSVKAGKKSATVKYKKVTGASGYQIAYSTSKTKGFKYVNVSYKNASSVIKKLTSKKTYYFKVRAYKTVGKTKKYGTYSNIKSIKVK